MIGEVFMDWLEIKEFFKDTIKIILCIVVILILIQYVFSITTVVGESMSPTLQDGEVFVLNKFRYRFTDIRRGEVISLKYADTKYLIKRVIGLPGDSISIRNNKVYINGEEYIESYLPDHLVYDNFELSSLGYEKIPENMYFVLGDNRENSLDSREIGLVYKDDVIGKVSIRFWPITRFKLV